MNITWIKRFSKSSPFYIFVTNICIGILINLASGLYCLLSDDTMFSVSRILKTFFIVLIPTYIILPTLISRLYFDFKHRKDIVKNSDDWYEDIYDKIIVLNIIGFAAIVVLILIFHDREYSFPDYFDSYWDTY